MILILIRSLKSFICGDVYSPALLLDEVKSKYVLEAYQLIASKLHSMESARQIMKQKGMCLSKQTFINLLQNISYTGRIKLRAYKDEPAQVIQGSFEPIVPEELFQTVQYIISGKKKPYQGKTRNEELILMGNLYCPECDKAMTGSGFRGNGGIYHYYHCQRKYGCKNSFRAERLQTYLCV